MSTLHKDHRDVLIAPVVSEKSYGLLDNNKYTFLVRPDANMIFAPVSAGRPHGQERPAAPCCSAPTAQLRPANS